LANNLTLLLTVSLRAHSKAQSGSNRRHVVNGTRFSAKWVTGRWLKVLSHETSALHVTNVVMVRCFGLDVMFDIVK